MNRTTHTYREISHQPDLWKDALCRLDAVSDENRKLVEKYRDRVWVFTGCGTSFYLAQTASTLFTTLTGIPSQVVPSSEIMIYPENVFAAGNRYLLVPISRSGASTEVLFATQIATRQMKIPSLAVSCSPQSGLVMESTHALHFPFQTEKSVVMTGSFTTMLLAMIHLGLSFRDEQGLRTRLHDLPGALSGLLSDAESLIESIACDPEISDFIFLGQGPFFGIANEGALKIQEMSLSFSQSYHALEYRHGPKSTATQHTLITVLQSRAGHHYEMDLIKDLHHLGAKILLITAGIAEKNQVPVDHQVVLKSGDSDILNPLLYTPLLQLLGYFKAIGKKLNPDNPRNLTAVVEFQVSENGKYE